MTDSRIYRLYDWFNRHAAVVAVTLIVGIIAIGIHKHDYAAVSIARTGFYRCTVAHAVRMLKDLSTMSFSNSGGII